MISFRIYRFKMSVAIPLFEDNIPISSSNVNRNRRHPTPVPASYPILFGDCPILEPGHPVCRGIVDLGLDIFLKRQYEESAAETLFCVPADPSPDRFLIHHKPPNATDFQARREAHHENADRQPLG
jgi:hypothetical protein